MNRVTPFVLALALGLPLALPAVVGAQSGVPTQPASATDFLTVGDKAPKLAVAEWVKGAPVSQFEPGKVYVVEFWATWCGPCKVSIPHITDLAAKNKDVTFIGVSVWEREKERDGTPADVPAKVKQFVKDMGEKMEYTVARDDKPGSEGVMAKTWMDAAQQDGIPTAFIVNKDGVIAWIGHPMEMDEPLGKVLAGTWDLAKAAKESVEGAEKAAKERAAQKEAMAIRKAMAADMKPVQEALRAEDWPAALKGLDAVIAKYPAQADRLRLQKFQVLMRSDEAGAYAYAKALGGNEFKGNAVALNEMAWTILDTPELKSPDNALALDLATRAVDLDKKNWMIIDTLALATFRTGDTAKAVELQRQALKLAKDADNAPAEAIDELEGRLKEFEARKP